LGIESANAVSSEPYAHPVIQSGGRLLMALSAAIRLSRHLLTAVVVSAQSALVAFQLSDFDLDDKKSHVYNMLWVLVFGFATLNILGLVLRRMEPRKSGLSFGEIIAVAVVCVSVILLAWELLYLFHILPIKLEPR
jgi:hypothetical protein